MTSDSLTYGYNPFRNRAVFNRLRLFTSTPFMFGPRLGFLINRLYPSKSPSRRWKERSYRSCRQATALRAALSEQALSFRSKSRPQSRSGSAASLLQRSSPSFAWLPGVRLRPVQCDSQWPRMLRVDGDSHGPVRRAPQGFDRFVLLGSPSRWWKLKTDIGALANTHDMRCLHSLSFLLRSGIYCDIFGPRTVTILLAINCACFAECLATRTIMSSVIFCSHVRYAPCSCGDNPRLRPASPGRAPMPYAAV